MDSLIRGLSTTVIGLITVIATLALIALVITVMGKALRKSPKAETPKKAEEPLTETPPAAYEDDLELVAVITAAISAYTGMSPQRFKIFGIKPSDTETWRKMNKKTTDF